MDTPKVFADFHNADGKGRLRLNCKGTIDDLAYQNIELSEGLELILADDEVEGKGRATYSESENIWVAEIDWGELVN